MNRETTISTITEPARRIRPPSHQASRAPAASRKPVTNGLWFQVPRWRSETGPSGAPGSGTGAVLLRSAVD